MQSEQSAGLRGASVSQGQIEIWKDGVRLRCHYVQFER